MQPREELDVQRPITLLLALTLFTVAPAFAGTFDRAPLAPALGVDALNRDVTRQQLGRDLFSDPYAAVTIGNVDVYDVFPYVESRQFQVVSDPRWNRLVFGEAGRSLAAYDGKNGPLGALLRPRGLASDELNRIYVADSGHDRVVVLQASTEFDEMTLVPLFAIEGLSDPYDVAYSDGGTPFQAGDDRLYVADTGRNRVVSYALEASGARVLATVGDLGSGSGRFAGPLAIAVGRVQGANTNDVYVADAHTRRIVHLRDDGATLAWVSDQGHDADVVTSLDTDQWGNLYAAAPNGNVVRKYNAAMSQVAELRGDIARPRAFDVPFLNVRDHRDGRTERVGQPSGVVIEQWSDRSGAQRWNLGVDVVDLAVVDGEAPTARFTLTDAAAVTIDVTDAATGRSLARRTAGAFGAGLQSLVLGPDDLRGATGNELILRVSAASSYPGGASVAASTRFHVDATGAVLPPNQPALLGNSPNPVMPMTRIAFMLPSAPSGAVTLRVFDAQGRLARTLDRAFGPGLNEVVWDGSRDDGRPAAPGVYFYRLGVGELAFTRRMVLVR
jgi:hypothetical protein